MHCAGLEHRKDHAGGLLDPQGVEPSDRLALLLPFHFCLPPNPSSLIPPDLKHPNFNPDFVSLVFRRCFFFRCISLMSGSTESCAWCYQVIVFVVLNSAPHPSPRRYQAGLIFKPAYTTHKIRGICRLAATILSES